MVVPQKEKQNKHISVSTDRKTGKEGTPERGGREISLKEGKITNTVAFLIKRQTY